MEQTFGVSYPTIKARLNRISGQLQFIETDPSPSRAEILARLKAGEITAEEAIKKPGGPEMTPNFAVIGIETPHWHTPRLWLPLFLL